MRINKKPDTHANDGPPNALYPVIVYGTPEWDDWMEYFEHTGNPHGSPHSYARKVGRMTVRSLLPEMTDPDWRSRPRASIPQGTCPPKPNYVPSSGRPLNPYEQERQKQSVERLVTALKNELGKPMRHGAKDRRDYERERREAREWLEQHYEREPSEVSVSPSLAEKLQQISPVQRNEAAE